MDGVIQVFSKEFWVYIFNDLPLLLLIGIVLILLMLAYRAFSTFVRSLFELLKEKEKGKSESEDSGYDKKMIRSLNRILFVGLVFYFIGAFFDLKDILINLGFFLTFFSVFSYALFFSIWVVHLFISKQIGNVERSKVFEQYLPTDEHREVFLKLSYTLIFGFIASVIILISTMAGFEVFNLVQASETIFKIIMLLTGFGFLFAMLVITFLMVDPTEEESDGVSYDRTKVRITIGVVFGVAGFLFLMQAFPPSLMLVLGLVILGFLILYQEEARNLFSGLYMKFMTVKKIMIRKEEYSREIIGRLYSTWKKEGSDEITTLKNHHALKFYHKYVEVNGEDFDDDDFDFDDDDEKEKVKKLRTRRKKGESMSEEKLDSQNST